MCIRKYGLCNPTVFYHHSLVGRKSERAIARPCFLLRFGKTDANACACVIEKFYPINLF